MCDNQKLTLGIETAPIETLCVLGMHRSGTSCLAGSIQAAGFSGGDVIEYTNDNPKGNKENRSIMALNDKVLAYNGGSWNLPPDSLEFTTEHQQERDILLDNYHSQFATWMFKDPRTVITLPFWQQAIRNLQLIGTFRHPLKVAMSLYQRQTISVSLREGIKLWIYYNNSILEAHNNTPFPLICFDLPQQQYLAKLEEIISNLNLRIASSCQLSISKALQFYESKLVHQENIEVLNPAPKDAELVAQAEKIYQQLMIKADLKIVRNTDRMSALYVPIDDDRTAYLKAIEAQPDNSQLYFMLANLERDEGDLDAAIANYKTSLKLNPGNLIASEQLSQLLARTDKYSEAIALVTNQLKFEPKSPRTYLILADLHRQNSNFEAEIAIYRQLVKLVPQNDIFQIRLGNKLIQRHQNAEAVISLQESLKLFPEQPDLYFALGKAYFKQQKFEQAIALYQQALKLNHLRPATVYHHLGTALVKSGQVDKALEAYYQAIKFDPDNFNTYVSLGNCYRQTEAWERAISSYKEAVELGCQSVGAYFGLGQTLRTESRISEAISAYQDALRVQPQHYHSYVGLGHCYRHLKDLNKAIINYQKSLEINPNNANLWFVLGQTRRQQGKKEEAVTCYQKAISVNHPNLFAVYKTMGDTFKEIDRTDKAIAAFKQALEIKPHHPEVKQILDRLIEHKN